MTEMQVLLCPKTSFLFAVHNRWYGCLPWQGESFCFFYYSIHTVVLFILASYSMTNGDNNPEGRRGRNAELTLNTYLAPDLRLCRNVGSHSVLHRGSVFNLLKPTGNFTYHQV